MSKILRPHFNFYRNEAHYEFFVVFKGKIIAFPVIFTLVQPFMPEFDDLADKEGKLVDAQKKSPFTALIVEADNLNDRLILGIRETVSGAMRHYDPTIAAAAVRLNDRLKAFGKIEKKSYEEEAAAISILVADLQSPAFAADATTVGIDGWVSQLVISLDNFKSLLQQRNDSMAPNLPKENLKTIRAEIEKVYHKMIARINAAAELDESGQYEMFIQQLNAEILYFNEHTHRSAKKDLAEGDHTVIEPIEIQIYSGEPVTPLPVVYYREVGKETAKLVFSEDFITSYKNNLKPGMATLTVHGKGHYKGKKSTTFSIERKKE
jgi:hypothetical protein